MRRSSSSTKLPLRSITNPSALYRQRSNGSWSVGQCWSLPTDSQPYTKPIGSPCCSMAKLSSKGDMNSSLFVIHSIVSCMSSSSTKPQSNIHRRRFSFAEELKIRCWALLARGALRLLGLTTRKQYIGGEELLARWQRREQVILAFWHSRILLMPFAYRGQKACIMNSVHRDGEIITRVIKHFGVAAVRGSSTRGWMGGLKGM